ncbi:Clp protease ClpP [Anaerovorax odorimutans]|uniref:ATP-dependent Clp protease proteolytic subunit n=1 Tax=Anaerovorax odorimutans TaxID=109327 RepID=A0ABT1RR54_9FIRM|nr:head maturation protease, ClpP-related [Anaerovorax odorimutans]MCQ4637678.1 Clp protease ClpP [Anaerovorax odorimutans]
MDLQMTNKKGKIVSKGKLEIKNQSVESADLFIYGDIISDSWYKWCDEDTCPQDILDFLSGLEHAQNINIYINSGGGSVWAGIAIYQQLKRHNAKKTVYIDGIGASIASVIAMAADELIMPEGSMLMIHKPMNGFAFEMLNADELRESAEMLDRAQENITDIYMTKVVEGVSREEICKAINKETWMNATKAQEYFKVNIDSTKTAATCNSSYFNIYRNAPSDLNNKKEIKTDTQKVNPDVDMNEFVDRVAAKLKEPFESIIEKQELLADLGQFGA